MKTISEMTTKEMVAEYNSLTGKSIKKFSSRAAGEKQLTAVRKELPANAITEDAELIKLFGLSHCPECKVNLGNGVMDFDSLEADYGKAKALTMQAKEFSCMGCNAEWGESYSINATRSAGIAKSWTDPKTAAKRKARHGVVVYDAAGKPITYRSVKHAFEEIGLPLNKHIKFRMEVKTSGKATFTTEDGSYEFTLVEK